MRVSIVRRARERARVNVDVAQIIIVSFETVLIRDGIVSTRVVGGA
jgi:hypothetical protein